MSARLFGHWFLVLGAVVMMVASEPSARVQRSATIFEDDFESGLGRWQTSGTVGVAIRDSGGPARKHVLELVPNGDVYALIKGSQQFGKVRLEGNVRFVDNTDNYLGVIYNQGSSFHDRHVVRVEIAATARVDLRTRAQPRRFPRGGAGGR